jgi:hypothetical protein
MKNRCKNKAEFSILQYYFVVIVELLTPGLVNHLALSINT